MKKLVLTIIMLICVFFIYGQSLEKLDGNYWNTLTQKEKEIFITGISQGQYSAIWYMLNIDENIAKFLFVNLNTITPVKELVKRIDVYYSIKLKNTPIWLVMFIVEGKAELLHDNES